MSGTAVAACAAAHVSSPFDNGGSHAAAHGGALHSPLRTKEISSPTNMKASAWELLWSPYYVLLEQETTALDQANAQTANEKCVSLILAFRYGYGKSCKKKSKYYKAVFYFSKKDKYDLTV